MLPPTLEPQIDDLLHQLSLREKTTLLSGVDNWRTLAIERLGIAPLVMTDGPHGVRATNVEHRPAGPTTAFPTGVGLASTWDPALIEQVGVALAAETLAMGADVLLGPCVNIMRTVLGGRNFETYSEDPYLAGQMAIAWIRGLQSQGVGASLKHFACNNQEFERFRGNSVVDERTLREIYLPAFEAAVTQARPWTVMCSYNRLNGEFASQNRYLLTEILKDEWGFDGVVVSDWDANHTTVASLAAGLDLEMPGPPKYYGRLLAEAVHYWQIDEAAVDAAVRRVLRLLVRAGKLPGAAPRQAGAVNTPDHRRLAVRAAEAGIVLLKNDGGLLPLDPSQITSIAVIGPNASSARLGGGGSAYVDPPYSISPLEGLQARFGDVIALRYEQGCANLVEPPVLAGPYVRPAGAEAAGLHGEYFDDVALSGPPTFTQVDPGLDFHWVRGGPAGLPRGDRFSIRWTGELAVPDAGRYRLTLTHTATARVYLDDACLIDHTVPEQVTFDPAHATATVEADLGGGRPYRLRVEFLKPAEERHTGLRLGLARVQGGDDARIARAAELARACDVAIVCAGLPEQYETEGHDRPDWLLPGPQAELIQAVVRANPRTIVVLNCGAPVDCSSWVAGVPALVLAHYPGLEGGHALARILAGDVDPSGRLTATWPRRFADNPSFLNYPGARDVRYGEGIFVGYRYYDHRAVEPLFPFGHGLSYTTFDFGDLVAPAEARCGQPVQVSLVVSNTGPVAGQEVVQLYICDREAALPRPPQELKRFVKVALAPGQPQRVTFELDARAFAFYDPLRRAWIVEPGEFELRACHSSRDIRARAIIRLT